MALTHCSKCGKELADKARTCSNCDGSPVAAVPPTSRSQSSSWITKFIGLAVLIAFGFGFLVAAALVAWSATTSFLSAPQAPQFIHHTDILTSGELTVAPAQPQVIPVNVDTATMKNIRISGMFSAFGGTDNGIEALILDQNNYANWRDGHRARVLYQSGLVTVGNIAANLTNPGNYYVVFSGRAIVVARTVHADLKLDYDKLVN